LASRDTFTPWERLRNANPDLPESLQRKQQAFITSLRTLNEDLDIAEKEGDGKRSFLLRRQIRDQVASSRSPIAEITLKYRDQIQRDPQQAVHWLSLYRGFIDGTPGQRGVRDFLAGLFTDSSLLEAAHKSLLSLDRHLVGRSSFGTERWVEEGIHSLRDPLAGETSPQGRRDIQERLIGFYILLAQIHRAQLRKSDQYTYCRTSTDKTIQTGQSGKIS